MILHLPSVNCFQVAGVLHIWVVCRISVPVLLVLFLHQAGHHQSCAYDHVFQLHADRVICLLLPDRHNRLLRNIYICEADFCQRED